MKEILSLRPRASDALFSLSFSPIIVFRTVPYLLVFVSFPTASAVFFIRISFGAVNDCVLFPGQASGNKCMYPMHIDHYSNSNSTALELNNDMGITAVSERALVPPTYTIYCVIVHDHALLILQ